MAATYTTTVTVSMPSASNGTAVKFEIAETFLSTASEIYERGTVYTATLSSGAASVALPVPDNTGDSAARYYVTGVYGDRFNPVPITVVYSASPVNLTTLIDAADADVDALTTLLGSYLLTANGVDRPKLAAAVAAGATSVTLTRSTSGLTAGQYIVIDAWTVQAELRQVATATAGGAITFSNTLDYTHAAGDWVIVLDEPTTIPQWWGAVGDGTTSSGDALRAWAEQHRQLKSTHGIDGLMYAPAGVYMFDFAPHPDNANIPVGFWSSNLRGAGMHATIFKLENSQTFFGTKAPYLIGNYEVGSATTPGVEFADFTINGNAANQDGLGWSEMAGLKFTKTRRGWARRVLVKNVYSTGHSPDSEGFAIKWAVGADGGAEACITDNDDSSGNESSGFSMSSCINMWHDSCMATNSPLGNCYTANKCFQLLYTGCVAQLSGDTTDRTGFNLERSVHVTYTNCMTGGYAHNVSNVDPYTTSEDLGCRAGWVLNSICEHVTIDGCVSAATDIGVIFKGVSLTSRIVGGTRFVDNGKGVNIDTTDTTDPAQLYIAPDTIFEGSTTADVSIGGGFGSTTWRGYNTPSLPATTVALVNPFPADCLIGLSGGTVTDVAIKTAPGNNYRTAGTGAGQYKLPHGASIKLTYSSAPTWYWIVGA